MLLLDGKSFFRSQKDLKLIYLWASIALELFALWYIFNTKNQYVEWLVMVAWCCQPNYCYMHFQYVVAWWKIIFQKSKRPKTHLLMSFNSIRIMAGNTFSPPKINMWSDWCWWLGVSTQTIVIFTFNMLLLDGKSFFRSQNILWLIYL